MKAAALALAASWSILVAGPMAQAFAEPAPSRATVQSRVRGLLAEEEGVVRGLDALDREIESLVRQTESARIDLADLGVVLEGLETEVAGLMEQLLAGLVAQGLMDDEAAPVPTDDVSPELAAAVWSYRHVYQDHSHGVHNPAYTRALLQAGIDALP